MRTLWKKRAIFELQQQLDQIAEGINDMPPEDMQRLKDMMAELNRMLEQRANGEEPDFDGFMERYGDFFPENPRTLDELLECDGSLPCSSQFLPCAEPLPPKAAAHGQRRAICACSSCSRSRTLRRSSSSAVGMAPSSCSASARSCGCDRLCCSAGPPGPASAPPNSIALGGAAAPLQN